jgi:hypothetical protein
MYLSRFLILQHTFMLIFICPYPMLHFGLFVNGAVHIFRKPCHFANCFLIGIMLFMVMFTYVIFNYPFYKWFLCWLYFCIFRLFLWCLWNWSCVCCKELNRIELNRTELHTFHTLRPFWVIFRRKLNTRGILKVGIEGTNLSLTVTCNININFNCILFDWRSVIT